MQSSSWKKCDLQVATPAWKFAQPSGSSYDFSDPAQRQSFLDRYMRELRSKGIEVIALADHNTGEWIDSVKEAGQRHGVIVFPGCEVTTSSGADGVHLLIIGDLDKTSQDFDRLLESVLGFTNLPRFHPRGKESEPASSSKTADQILDALPEGYIAIAPHVFGDNGLASENTVQGDLRWRALHHPRLSAVDPGDCSLIDGDSFRHRFCRRELTYFPCLADLPFIATSDAYSLEKLGVRFTWIRMGTPCLEALRQACLDYRARILCDWDERLASFPAGNPNHVRHAWIERVDLGGTLGNSTGGFGVPLHPNLNVIIGGRGSGKSTIVAAIRGIYGSTEELPERIREDVESFSATVFAEAELRSTHRLEESQQVQISTWTPASGSVVDGSSVPTDFPVRVFSQKELFERAAGDKRDPYLSSRGLLALLDQGLNLDGHGVREIGSLPREIESAKIDWSTVARSHAGLVADLGQLPSLRERVRILRGQVEAFSSPEVKERLARISSVQKLDSALQRARVDLVEVLDQLEQMAVETTPRPVPVDSPAEFFPALNDLNKIRETVGRVLLDAASGARTSLTKWGESTEVRGWKSVVEETEQDQRTYVEGLASRGLSQEAFNRLSQELSQAEGTLQSLEEKQAQVITSMAEVDDAWQVLMQHLSTVRSLRTHLLSDIQQRSGQLRFRTVPFMDLTAWIEAARGLMGLRADGYVPEMQALAEWLWGDGSERDQRWESWRKALALADFNEIRDQVKVKTGFFDRLGRLDETLLLRIATETPADVIQMDFLKEGGDPTIDRDWQSIAEGSPGQKTAAMLAFVLHHGHEPLVIDQPEDDLDSEWIAKLVVESLRKSRWNRQIIVVTHNANIPVLGDADQVVGLENCQGELRVRTTAGHFGHAEPHIGPVEFEPVRSDIQKIMEGGIDAFVKRERRYNTETLAARRRKTGGGN